MYMLVQLRARQRSNALGYYTHVCFSRDESDFIECKLSVVRGDLETGCLHGDVEYTLLVPQALKHRSMRLSAIMATLVAAHLTCMGMLPRNM